MRKVKISKNPTRQYSGNFKGNPIVSPYYSGTNPGIEINKTLKEVPEHLANVEAEKGETVMYPKTGAFGDFPALYNVGGKRHVDGGTNLSLPEDSFVFSDTKDMRIKDKTILAMFGKTVGKKGQKQFTPAELSKKYDINNFLKTLADPDATNIEKTTAEQMIKNYQLKLGQLALVQESSKGFPDGIPAVAVPYLYTVGVDPQAILGIQQEQTSAKSPMPGMQKGGSASDSYLKEMIRNLNKQSRFTQLNNNTEQVLPPESRINAMSPKELLQHAMTRNLQKLAREEQSYKRLGGSLPKAKEGGWNPDWTKKILEHERKFGQPGGNPDKKGIYADKNWIDNNRFEREYVDAVRKEIPGFDELPADIQVRLVDYKFNSGRSIKDLILFADNRITESQINSKNTYDNLWNEDIQKKLSDPNFIKKLDAARISVAKSTHKNDPDYKENLDKNWLPRIKMWDDYDFTETSDNKGTSTPTNSTTNSTKTKTTKTTKTTSFPDEKTAKQWNNNLTEYKLYMDEMAAIDNNPDLQKDLIANFKNIVKNAKYYGKNKQKEYQKNLENMTEAQILEHLKKFEEGNARLKAFNLDAASSDQPTAKGSTLNKQALALIEANDEALGDLKKYYEEGYKGQAVYHAWNETIKTGKYKQFSAPQYGLGDETIDGKKGTVSLIDNYNTNTTLGQRLGWVGDPEPTDDGKPKGKDKVEDYDINKAKYEKGYVAPEWWQQDVNNLGVAAGNFLGVKKYNPWLQNIDLQEPTPTFISPERALSANAEQANIAQNAIGAFAGPQALSSRQSNIQGTAAKNAADILSQTHNQNVGIANQFELAQKQIRNQEAGANAQSAQNFYDGTVIANQNYDNEKNQAEQVMLANYNQGLTNAGQTAALNAMNQHYQTDPTTGTVYFNRGSNIKPGTDGNNPPGFDAYLEAVQNNPNVDPDIIAKFYGAYTYPGNDPTQNVGTGNIATYAGNYHKFGGTMKRVKIKKLPRK